VRQTDDVIVNCAAYFEGERVKTWTDLEALVGWRDHCRGFVWLGLRIPSEEELGRACDLLDLDDVSAAELLRPHTRPVLSIDGPTTYLVLRTARYDDRDENIVLGEMTVLVGPDAVLSVRHGQASPLSAMRAEMERTGQGLQRGPWGVSASIIDRVIADYAPALDGFENDSVEAERDVFSDSRFQPVKRLYKLKREVRELLVAVDSLQDPLLRLIRHKGSQMPDAALADLNEAADQLDRTVTRIQSLSNLLDAALTASLAQISVQQNEDMRRISAWVAMAAVPTLIAGVYGMNFDHFPELHWTYGYPLVLGVMGGIVGLMYRGFKRGGWF